MSEKRYWEVSFTKNGARITTTVLGDEEGPDAINRAREKLAIAFDIPLRLLFSASAVARSEKQ